MGLFSKKRAQVVRKGSSVEQRSVRSVGGETVTVRRFTEGDAPRQPATQKKQKQGGKSSQRQRPARRRRPTHLEVVAPPETARKQMLVRTLPHQTQIVVMEGPVLVEHYVARSDKQSLVGNVYLGKVRNVLPGMEAAFIDFGAGKNGVLYAGDVNFASYELGGKPKRIESVLAPGDPVLVQVVKDAIAHKAARVTGYVSLPGRYLVYMPMVEQSGV